MKKNVFLFIVFSCYSAVSLAQWNTNGTTPNYSLGNVGIGTTSPRFPIDIEANTTGSIFHVRNNITTNWFSTLIYGQVAQGDSPSYDLMGLYNNNNTLKYQVRGDGNVYMDGNVGIGTTSPQNKFVVSDSNSGLEISPYTVLGNAKGGYITAYNRTSKGYNDIIYDQNGSSYTVFKNNGNVGIGTTNPQNKFVVSDSNSGLEISPNTTLGNATGAYITAYNQEMQQVLILQLIIAPPKCIMILFMIKMGRLIQFLKVTAM